MPSKPSESAYSSWSMYSWYMVLAFAGSNRRLSMSTQTEWWFWRKSSGRCGHGIKLNQVNLMRPPPRYLSPTLSQALPMPLERSPSKAIRDPPHVESHGHAHGHPEPFARAAVPPELRHPPLEAC